MLVRLSLWLATDGLKSKPRQKKTVERRKSGETSLIQHWTLIFPDTNTAQLHRKSSKFHRKRNKNTHCCCLEGDEANFWEESEWFSQPASVGFLVGKVTCSFHKYLEDQGI